MSALGSECLLAPPSTTGVCSASGLCVECLSETDCPNPGDTCESNNTCKANHCENTMQDVALGETDVDCGGPCPACPNGDGCDSADDCQTLFCSTANVCANCENQTSCGSGFYCSQLDSTCKAKLPVGQGCLQDYQCSSNCCFGLFCGFSAQC